MEEFHPRKKMANVYFLVLASLQTIQEISNTFGMPTILLPLSIVVLIDAVFAILEARGFDISFDGVFVSNFGMRV